MLIIWLSPDVNKEFKFYTVLKLIGGNKLIQKATRTTET